MASGASYIEVFIDGASRNPGSEEPYEAAYAFVIYKNKKFFHQVGRCLGAMTNNQAEYEALINALQTCWAMELPRPIIYCDSQVVVKHTTGEWKIKSIELLPFYLTVKNIQAEYSFDIIQVPRNKVFVADGLCNVVLDQLKAEKTKMLSKKNGGAHVG